MNDYFVLFVCKNSGIVDVHFDHGLPSGCRIPLCVVSIMRIPFRNIFFVVDTVLLLAV